MHPSNSESEKQSAQNETGITPGSGGLPPVAPLDAGAITAEPKGLPPVKAPSGRFLVQLFLVPGAIVFTVVCFIIVWDWLVGGPRSPEDFLKKLDSSNPDVRWRAAADLAQILPRDEKLASNASFALEVTQRLDKAVQRIKSTEQRHLKEPLTERDLKNLEDDRQFILFLTSCLGNFRVPVGAMLLNKLALSEEGIEEEALFRRRARALWALTTLGDNVNKFLQMPAEKQNDILEQLEEESQKSGERGRSALLALEHLRNRKAGKDRDVMGVSNALIECARDDAPSLRKQAIVAMNFWDGDKVEDTLLKLAEDDGRGKDPIERDEKQEEYRQNHPVEVRERTQREIRYSAVMALARRGSPKVARWFNVLKEMLDVDKQKMLWKGDDPALQGSPEAEAYQMVYYTLKAVAELHRKVPEMDLSSLKPSIDGLTESSNSSVSTEAKELQLALTSKQ